MKLLRFRLIALLLSTVQVAFAQDGCEQVLKDGTRRTLAVQRNLFFFQQLISSTSIDVDEQSARAFAPEFGEWSSANKHHYIEAFRKQIDLSIYQREDFNLWASTGDETIVNAWSSCIFARSGGLSMHFSPVNATQAFLILRYYAPPGVDGVRTRLHEDVNLGGVVIKQNADCLTTLHVYTHGDECAVLLEAPAKTPIPIAANTESGRSATAYLPPRQFLKATLHVPWIAAASPGGNDNNDSYVNPYDKEALGP